MKFFNRLANIIPNVSKKIKTLAPKNEIVSNCINIAITSSLSLIGAISFTPNAQAGPKVDYYDYTSANSLYKKPIDQPSLKPASNVTGPIVTPATQPRVSYNNRSYINPMRLQESMRGLSGAFAVADVNGTIVASVSKDTMLQPASVGKLFTTVAALEAYPISSPSSYFNPRLMAALKEANSTSDNLFFERLGDGIGLDFVQSTIRRITYNNSITIGNGSGCGNGTRANAAHSCGGRSKVGRSTKISVGDTIKVLKYLNNKLNAMGLRMEDVMGSSYDNRSTVSSRYKNALNYSITGKTGTLVGIYSLAGIMYGPNNETIYFATVTNGSKASSVSKHVKVLNSAFGQ